MPPRPFLDADNIHAVVTTKWEPGTYQPLTIRSVESYTIETNLDEDSDPFNIIIGDPYGDYAEMLHRDNEVRMQIFGIGEDINYLMTGIVDTAVYSDEGVFVCSGRDLSCIATDTIAEPITYRHMRASDVIAQRARALKCAPRINLTPTNILGKIQTDGSETEWEFWYRYIRRAGQWLWYEPDGTLRSGILNYEADPTFFFGEPPKGVTQGAWIPVETGEFHSSKQQRLGKAILYYHNGGRILPVPQEDPTIAQWLRRPTKLFEQRDIVHRKAAVHFVKEEIFESKIGAQEIKLVVPDPGILIRQNTMARLNVPDLQLGGDWFIVGTRIIADTSGFTQEVRLREKNFAVSRRVPSDPPQSQEPGQSATDALAGTLQIPNHPEWAQYFINAANEFHGNKEFEFFLAVLLGICDVETGFKNERANTGGSNDAFIIGPGVRGVEWFDWDESVAGPQHGIKNLAEWRLSFANEPGPYVDFRFAVGPMQLYDKGLKIQADQFGAAGNIDELMGNRWSPEANIWIAAKYLHELCVSHHVDNSDNDTIWIAVAAYGGSDEYSKNVRSRVYSTWYPMVKEAFTAAKEAEGQKAVEAVQGTVQEIAQYILDAMKEHPPRYRDDNGRQVEQLQAMANGQRIDTPSCPVLGKIQLDAKTLGAVRLLLDAGFWVGTFAFASDHTHLGCKSRHSSGFAVDISSLGVPDVGWTNLAAGGKACQILTMRAMNVFRSQKRGVLKPNQMICNGVGGVVMKTVQSLQLDNFEPSNYVDGDHTNHIHIGY